MKRRAAILAVLPLLAGCITVNARPAAISGSQYDAGQARQMAVYQPAAQPAKTATKAQPTATTQAAQPANNGSVVIVTAHALHVRKAPSANAQVLAIVSQGDRLPLVAESGEWYQVQLGSVSGWVKAEFVMKGK